MPRHMDSKETALKLRWDVLGWAWAAHVPSWVCWVNPS